MADFTDRIKLVFDAVTSDATSDLGKLKGATDEAQSGWGKLKGAAGDAIGKIASSPAAVAAAGVAIAKVAFDLASNFEQAALSAQSFATASGLAVEDASRWQEVAGDLGVSTETLEGAVNKMNIAASKGVLAQLGIDGANTNEKLLASLEHLSGIADATERARQGAAIFGKAWAGLAPLVAESASLRDNLASVSDQKVIDQEEVNKAREMRDAMDKLSDTLDDIKLALGESLIGPLTDVAHTIGNVTDSINGLTDIIPGMPSALDILTSPLRNVTDGFDTLTDSSNSLGDRARGLGQAITGAIPGPLGSWASGLFDTESASEKAAKAAAAHQAEVERQAQAMQIAADAAQAQEDALTKLNAAELAAINSTLALADAGDRTEDALKAYATAAGEADAAAGGNKEANDKAAEAMRNAEQAALAQASAQLKLAQDQAAADGATLSAAQSNAILANSLRTTAGTLAADSPLRRDLLAYAQQIEQVPDNATTTFHADTTDATAKVNALAALIQRLNTDFFGALATIGKGTAIPSSSSAPSSITAPSSASGAQALSAAPMPVLASPVAAPRLMLAPAPVINLSVTVAPLTNPAEVGRQLADYLDAFYRRNGQRRIAAA